MLDMAEVVGTKSSSQFVFFLLLFAVNSHDLAVCQGKFINSVDNR